MRPLKITTAVRMLCEMRERLESKAVENGRSLSGEIVYRLRKSLEEELANEQSHRA
jgi:predicted DNA-binding protein